MTTSLRFDQNFCAVRDFYIEGERIRYRAYEGLDYCENPLDPIQKLNIFVPDIYYHDGTIHGYDLHTAPIFMPNTVGGYMPGPADTPGLDRHGHPNAVMEGLAHGYVVVCAGIRGRTSGTISAEFFEGGKAEDAGSAHGVPVGKSPALIVDMKAAVRYLRANKDTIPGNVERIFTSGTSAGGALSALTGASGNSSDYEEELQKIGALEERDDIFAANCYCPIHNLENADMAYEWMFNGENTYHMAKFTKEDGKVFMKKTTGELTAEQMQVSADLKQLFPSYVNSLHLTDDAGNELTLDDNGEGSFKEWVKEWVIRSADKELQTHDSENRLSWLMTEGSAVEKQEYLTIHDNHVTAIDWDGFIKAITRMKKAPAFDDLDLKSPENEEFGNETIKARHFTEYSYTHSHVKGEMAEESIIQMINPLLYVGKADTTKHWRIRHGSYDRDTALAIPVILATALMNQGYDVDFALPWGLPHSGDYDFEEMFAWIDKLCREEEEKK